MAEDSPNYPHLADIFTQSAWRIGWQVGMGLRDAPLGIKYGLENCYQNALKIGQQERK